MSNKELIEKLLWFAASDKPQKALNEALIQAAEALSSAEAERERLNPDGFWDWLPRAYRDGDKGEDPKFTKYNMEVAFLAGWEAARSALSSTDNST